MNKLNQRKAVKSTSDLSLNSDSSAANSKSILLSGYNNLIDKRENDNPEYKMYTCDTVNAFQREEIKKVVITITLETDSDSENEAKKYKSEECIVCFQDSLCFMLPCGHKTCGKCKKKWKKISKTCPICRKIIF